MISELYLSSKKNGSDNGVYSFKNLRNGHFYVEKTNSLLIDIFIDIYKLSKTTVDEKGEVFTNEGHVLD